MAVCGPWQFKHLMSFDVQIVWVWSVLAYLEQIEEVDVQLAVVWLNW